MAAPLRIAALVKQIPAFEELELGPDGRLRREGLELEMNPYCRRAAAEAVELAGESHGSVTFVTLGPPAAEDVLREAIAWAEARHVESTGVLVCDPAFAGSDTLATARALAATLARVGPFDLILVGRNSVDADTGQVGPELAEILDLPFATGVRELEVRDGVVRARCEHDDGWAQLVTALPAVLSTAERLCEPCKVDPEGRERVDAARIVRLGAADLGPGPWGQAGSATRVGATRVHPLQRENVTDPAASLDEQVRGAVDVLVRRRALVPAEPDAASVCPTGGSASPLLLAVEPDRTTMTREMLGLLATLARDRHAPVVAVVSAEPDVDALASWGADEVIWLRDPVVEEDVAHALARIVDERVPWCAVAPSTAWGREVAGRAAAASSSGLTGDAVVLECGPDDRMAAWKPAFGGQLMAEIRATSPTHFATLRPGSARPLAPRAATAALREVRVAERGRVDVTSRTRDDDVDVLAEAAVVIGVGAGVPPDEYGKLEGLREVLGAEIGATRKVTDKGWLPRARQIGITGRSIAPRLHFAIAASGKFNHSVGFRSAQTVLAINADASAPVFDHADAGVVADWRDAVPALTERLRAVSP